MKINRRPFSTAGSEARCRVARQQAPSHGDSAEIVRSIDSATRLSVAVCTVVVGVLLLTGQVAAASSEAWECEIAFEVENADDTPIATAQFKFRYRQPLSEGDDRTVARCDSSPSGVSLSVADRCASSHPTGMCGDPRTRIVSVALIADRPEARLAPSVLCHIAVPQPLELSDVEPALVDYASTNDLRRRGAVPHVAARGISCRPR